MSYDKLPLREHGRKLPKITKEEQLTIQIPPQLSPEEARKEIVKSVNIAEEDPEIVSDYDYVIKLWK